MYIEFLRIFKAEFAKGKNIMFDRTSLHVALLLWGCIFSLIAAFCMFMSSNFDKNKRKWLLFIMLTSALLLLSDAFAWEYRGRPGNAAYWVVVISNLCVFVMSDVMLALYNGYISTILYKKDDKGIRKVRQIPDKRILAVYIIAAIGIVMCILSQFLHIYYYIDENNFYHRNLGHIISMIIPIIGMIIDALLIIENRKRINRLTFVSLLSYMFLPFAAVIVQMFYYGISLINIAISISMILMFVASMIEQNENIARKEKEAADLRISIMISQIAPHFIYNTLTSIKEMCSSDPEMAGELTGQFAEYLRGNLESLNMDKPVPFERELSHVKCYAAIEEKRFAGKVKVEYNIYDDEFLIPSLTLQPLVENAVKHGLRKKRGGGTVTIQTERIGDEIHITIKDDGVGFNMADIQTDDKIHVGIENVRRRLHDMCGGTLKIKSQPGIGTCIEIILPQK